MKVVCCKKCGAKYQLEDNDDINAFECSSCTGELELCEGYSSEENNNFVSENSNIAYCVNCGLKYSLKPSDNILDYECESCGGSLRYVDEYLNEDIDKIVEEQEKQRIIEKIESLENGEKEPKNNNHPQNVKKALTNRFERFFSEHNLEEELKKSEEKKQKEELKKTAKTKIPKATRTKFEKEFLVPKTNDYDILKEYLINEFYKSMGPYYGITEVEDIPNGTFRKYSDIQKINLEVQDNDFKNSINLKEPKNIAIILGIIIFIISAIEIFVIKYGIGIFTIFIGVILICYGLYRTKDEVEVKKRSKIIRNHLLTLPEEYYVFYDVRVPGSNHGINHLVIGPSGIYEILSQKYNPKAGASIENTPFLEEEDNEEKIEEIISPNNIRLFKYTTKQTKFTQDNKIKQKALQLGENLINFLNENEIHNCFVEPLVGFVNDNVVVINMPLTDEDLFIDELMHKIKYGSVKLDSETIDKCAVLLSKYAADCSLES